jgi:hypothetical protein
MHSVKKMKAAGSKELLHPLETELPKMDPVDFLHKMDGTTCIYLLHVPGHIEQ